MQDLETCKGLGKSAALVLDNKVGDARLAEQMIEDLKLVINMSAAQLCNHFFNRNQRLYG